ncbi:hypothetical protein [Aromatoleum toluclasticum]|uniref:hypothetical protein n=1 Tax=Aromatoleum toluclasticum TaxID=92003 RepID=UPI00036E1BB5|nr:hypothetical protein [Aromatoleum toluclasticum]
MPDREVPIQWDGGERRRTSPYTMRELEEHIDERIRLRLADHAADEGRRMDGKFDELKTLLASAFPGGDPLEHKRYHDEVIEWMQERRALWISIREKTITGLLWALLVGMGGAIWHAIKTKILGG